MSIGRLRAGARRALTLGLLSAGWLVVPVHHGTSSDLAGFATADLAAGPRSVVRLPVTVPVATRTGP